MANAAANSNAGRSKGCRRSANWTELDAERVANRLLKNLTNAEPVSASLGDDGILEIDVPERGIKLQGPGRASSYVISTDLYNTMYEIADAWNAYGNPTPTLTYSVRKLSDLLK